MFPARQPLASSPTARQPLANRSSATRQQHTSCSRLPTCPPLAAAHQLLASCLLLPAAVSASRSAAIRQPRQLLANHSPTARRPLVSHSPAAHKLLPLANPPAARHRTPAADWLPAAHQLLASMLLSPTARQPLANRSPTARQPLTSGTQAPATSRAKRSHASLPVACH